jgi:23S rRNA pseudouridine2605 synthase
VVTRLIRVSYGPFQLGNLPKGMADEMPGRVIAEQTGDGPAKPMLTLKPKPRTGPKLKPGQKNAHRRRKI